MKIKYNKYTRLKIKQKYYKKRVFNVLQKKRHDKVYHNNITRTLSDIPCNNFVENINKVDDIFN